MSHPYFTDEGKKHIQRVGGTHSAKDSVDSARLYAKAEKFVKQGGADAKGGEFSSEDYKTSEDNFKAADKAKRNETMKSGSTQKSDNTSVRNTKAPKKTQVDDYDVDSDTQGNMIGRKIKRDSYPHDVVSGLTTGGSK